MAKPAENRQSGSVTDGNRTLNPAIHQTLGDLVTRVDDVQFPLAVETTTPGENLQAQLKNQLTDYLMPRVADTEAPLLIVFGGSTGAGKSTLINSIIGEDVSSASVLRPTTRWPVLVCNPADRTHFTSNRILPGLERVSQEATDTQAPQVRIVDHPAIPPGVAVLDSPDIDSVMDSNRKLARQLLAAADLWVFVTTAARYADAVPWELLKQSADNGTAVAMVLDRVPPNANREVRHHLSSLLKDARLGTAPIFTVPELTLEDGRLPQSAIFPLRSWIANLSSNPRARNAVVQRTLHGALAAVPDRVEILAEYAQAQVDAHERLAEVVDTEFAHARQRLGEALVSGHVLRGEVLARWQDFVGTGQLFRGLEPTVARIRDRITSAITGKRDTAEPLGQAIESSAALLVREQAVTALGGVTDAWHETTPGRTILKDNPQLEKLPADMDATIKRTIAEWSDQVNDLVRDVGQSKRARARILSFGVNGVGAVLMLAVFAGTGGLTGAEAGIAGGTAVVAGKLLDTIFGDQVTRDLASKARHMLLEATGELLTSFREPFDSALKDRTVNPEQAAELRTINERLKGML